MPNPLSIPSGAACLLGISLPLLVISEHRSRSHIGTGIFKMLSSTAFLIIPVLSSTKPSPYHSLISTGLTFSLIGDFCLIPSRSDFYHSKTRTTAPKPRTPSLSFHLGILAFAAAHISYIAALLHDSRETLWSMFIIAIVTMLAIAKWLGVVYPPSHASARGNVLDLCIPEQMKPLVSMYAFIIGVMFAAAVSTAPLEFVTPWPYQRTLGAGMFVASDLFVAKDAFGRSCIPQARGWFRIAMGYGLYFWGQAVIAGTICGQYTD
ncbi:YhhN-like protein [Aspergillus avenaceus]|uniref:YhhN-like protein n=1 Tax=Aspergillus avenaceus TaxID=36643 RepID=A0A5N6U6K1_ASPAV|nr:YhhN-like protein [Aspergillus avenaceus]